MSPRETWEQVFERVELRNPPYPIKLHLEREYYNTRQPVGADMGVALIVETAVSDRDTGRITMVVYRKPLSPYPGTKEIYYRLREVFLHELSESFHVDGERVHDPHVNDPEHLRPSP